MQIIGIGTEIVECVRISRMIQKHGELFLATVFTPREMRLCGKRKNAIEHFAAQWAGKEAVIKALAIRAGKKLAWTDLEIRHEPNKQSTVCATGALEDMFAERQISAILVSLAHCRVYATAFAIALKG